MSLLAAAAQQQTLGGDGGSTAVDDFNAVALASYDLDAEGFADTTAITTLTDQTSNGNDLSQATSSKKPIADTDGSGTKMASLNGDAMAVTFTAAAAQPLTYIALARYSDVDANIRILYDGTTSNRIIMMSQSGTFNWGALTATLTGPTDDALWHVLVGVADGSSSELYEDGGAAAATGNIGSNGVDGLTFGSRPDQTANFWVGDFAFGGIYEGDLVTDDLTLLNDLGQALADRVGITWTDIT